LDDNQRAALLSQKLEKNDNNYFEVMKNKFIQSNSEQMYLGPDDDSRVTSLLAMVNTDKIPDFKLQARDYMFV
jgi:hypothetical protein